MQPSFYNYKKYRWFWLNLLLLVTLIIFYFLNHPLGGRSGGSTLGYIYGGIATFGILILMSYAKRKRAYHSNLGTLQGWLSCHVWLGVTLLAIVPLHCAFSFGINVHTLAYVLMVITIVTGIWGAMNYAVLSSQIESHRGGIKSQAILEQVELVSKEIEQVISKRSDALMRLVHTIDFKFKASFFALLGWNQEKFVERQSTAQLLMGVPDEDRTEALKVIQLVDQKADLVRSLIEESRIKALLRIWLFVHVPVSVGLCVALAIHIFSVFYYH